MNRDRNHTAETDITCARCYDLILLAVGRAEGTTAALPDDALEIVMRGEEKEDQVVTA